MGIEVRGVGLRDQGLGGGVCVGDVHVTLVRNSRILNYGLKSACMQASLVRNLVRNSQES